VLDEHGTILETVDNSTNLNALKGAGIQAAKTLADRKVNTLITGNCGPNAYKALSAAGIKVAVEQTGTVKEAFERFQRNELEFADRPNVEGHW
jgi:predicted Fe-Mo cluster-binding NifX family protein